MQTNLHSEIKKHRQSPQIESILRSCVHCGFCNATCPTYQLLGDERDGPRGRIYLMKQFFESNEVSAKTREHLDRCLSCRSCETTCPSGVQYGKLIDIGRALIETRVERTFAERLVRRSMLWLLPYPKRFGFFLKLGQIAAPLLPAVLRVKIPLKQLPLKTLDPNLPATRTMIALAGCAQSVATPNTNAATKAVLARIGINVIQAPSAGCCGALSYHLGQTDDGLNFMRANIDAWWPLIEAGAEAIISTASGCGTMIQDYGNSLAADSRYALKAAKISALCKDIAEILNNEDLSTFIPQHSTGAKIAVHCPCTLQHAMKKGGDVEAVLGKLGFDLATTKENHLCCGSAGTYSILQPKIANTLGRNKINALCGDNPDCIVTSNIGCQLHLGSKTQLPVKHWIELLVSEAKS